MSASLAYWVHLIRLTSRSLSTMCFHGDDTLLYLHLYPDLSFLPTRHQPALCYFHKPYQTNICNYPNRISSQSLIAPSPHIVNSTGNLDLDNFKLENFCIVVYMLIIIFVAYIHSLRGFQKPVKVVGLVRVAAGLVFSTSTSTWFVCV